MGRLVGAVIVVYFLLTGCGALNWVKESPQKASTSQDLQLPEKQEKAEIKLGSDAKTAQELLALYESLHKAPSKEIRQHKALAKDQFQENETVDNGLEYALILTLSGRTEDMVQARSVVKALQKSKGLEQGDGYIGLVELLAQLTLYRAHSSERIERLEKKLDKREQELVTLKEQLDALKTIDQNIHEREVGTIHDGR